VNHYDHQKEIDYMRIGHFHIKYSIEQGEQITFSPVSIE